MRAKKLFQEHYKSPEELRRLDEEAKRAHQERECDWLVGKVYGHLTEAFKKGQTECTFTESYHWFSSYECAQKKLASDRVRLQVTDRNFTHVVMSDCEYGCSKYEVTSDRYQASYSQ